MGLLDGFFSDDPQKQAQMALALGLLSGNGGKGLSGFARNLGQAGMGAMQTYAFGSENARRNKLADTQNQMSQMQIDEMRRKLSDANTFREVLGGYQAPGPYEDAKASMPSLAPTVANQQTLDAKVAAAPVANGKRAEYERLLGIAKQLEQKGLVDYAQQYYDKARGAMPEVKETKTLTKDGQRVTVNIYKDGTQEVVPFGPDQEPLHFADNGPMTGIGLDKFTGRVVSGGIRKGMSPESADASARGWAGLSQADRHFAANYGKPQLVEGDSGFQWVTPPVGNAGPGVVPAGVKGSKNAPSEAELVAVGYANRMAEAEKLLGENAKAGLPTWATNLTSAAVGAKLGPQMGRAAEGAMMSPEQQAYRQAQEDWVRAKLRKESGAVIGEEEMAREINTYFPNPWDSEKVIRQKAQARRVAIEQMAKAAGKARGQFGVVPKEDPLGIRQ